MGVGQAKEVYTINEIANNEVSPSPKELVLPERIEVKNLHMLEKPTCEYLRSCLLEHGFAILSVGDDVLKATDESHKAAEEFFADSDENKLKYQAPKQPLLPRQNRWYVPGPRHEYLKLRMNDLASQYPASPENLLPAFQETQRKLMGIVASVIQATANGVVEGTKNDPWIEPVLAEQSTKRAYDLASLVLMHYFPYEQVPTENAVVIPGNEKIHQPLKEHCDTGMFTAIVVGTTEGLEVKDAKSQQWFCAERELRKNDILLIVGKAIRRMVDERVKIEPTPHRVVMQRDVQRISQFLYVTCNMCDI